MPSKPSDGHGGRRAGAGAKPMHANPMRRVNVMLDDATIAKAEMIGGGNLSAGLREVVRRARVCKSANDRLTAPDTALQEQR